MNQSYLSFFMGLTFLSNAVWGCLDWQVFARHYKSGFAEAWYFLTEARTFLWGTMCYKGGHQTQYWYTPLLLWMLPLIIILLATIIVVLSVHEKKSRR